MKKDDKVIAELGKFLEEYGRGIKYQEFLKGIEHTLTQLFETTDKKLLECKKEIEKNGFFIKELNNHISRLNKIKNEGDNNV